MSRAFSILAFTFLVACPACSAKTPTDPSEKEGDDAVQESDLSGGAPKYLGQIAPGETKTTSYTDPPLYRAYGFTATGGDKITIDVKSTDYGDAMAWLTTTSWKSIAANDDASAKTLDSHIEYTIPAGTASKSYRVVFRDYDKLAASFDVTLAVQSAAPPPPPVPACDPDAETWRNYLGTSPAQCDVLVFSCAADRRAFNNTCGCGCELLSH